MKGDYIVMNAIPWDPDRPYNALPLLTENDDLESKAVLRACIEARAALAELKRSAEQIPNQSMLINTLPLLEAQASSEIEHIVTTADRLFEYLDRAGDIDPETREAMHYREALMEGYQVLNIRPISTTMAESICSRIRGVEMQVRRVPGTKLAGTAGTVVYTPPEGEEHLRGLLADWERFMNLNKELDPLIRMAAGHYQFEAIHPFTDGNGRTGRILNNLFVVQEGLLTLPILYLSRYIIRYKSDYYNLLLGVTRERAWEAWLLFMLDAIRETASWTTDKITAIMALFEATVTQIRHTWHKIYSRELVEVLFTQPYCRIANLVGSGVAQRQTASRYLQILVDGGVLEERKVGREKIFSNPRLMELLTTDSNRFKPYRY